MHEHLTPLLDGLLYPSESDEPVAYLCHPWPSSESRLSCDDMRLLFVLSDNLKVVEREPAEFWDRVTTCHEWYDDYEKDRTQRFTQMKTALENEMGSLQYFEAGDIEITLYVLGISDDTVQGITTTAIRTT